MKEANIKRFHLYDSTSQRIYLSHIIYDTVLHDSINMNVTCISVYYFLKMKEKLYYLSRFIYRLIIKVTLVFICITLLLFFLQQKPCLWYIFYPQHYLCIDLFFFNNYLESVLLHIFRKAVKKRDIHLQIWNIKIQVLILVLVLAYTICWHIIYLF